MGLDYEQVADFDLFIMLSRTLPKERTEILLGELDLSNMRPFNNPQNDEIILIDRGEARRLVSTFMVNRSRIRALDGRIPSD